MRMKKYFKQYSISWVVMFVLFNVIAFVYPSSSKIQSALSISKYDSSFWVGYVTIIIAFIGQFICTYKVFKDNSLEKLFHKLPVLNYSYTSLIATTIVGILIMVIKAIPNWLGIILCAVVLGISIIVLSKANASGDIALEVGEKIKRQTSSMKELTSEAERLMASAETDEQKKVLKSLYEALRYSDPMSTEKTAELEASIGDGLKDLSKEFSKEKALELVALIEDRNRVCKSSKG